MIPDGCNISFHRIATTDAVNTHGRMYTTRAIVFVVIVKYLEFNSIANIIPITRCATTLTTTKMMVLDAAFQNALSANNSV